MNVDPPRSFRERLPRGRVLGVLLATFLGCWLGYVWLASSIAERRLRTLAERAGVRVEQVEVRSWFPGRLVLRDLVVTHPLRGDRCRITAARIVAPHDPLKVIGGDVRIDTLRATDVELECGPALDPDSSLRRSKPTLGALTQGALAAAGEATTDAGSIEVQRVVIGVTRLALGAAELATPFELTAKRLVARADHVGLDAAQATLQAGLVRFQGVPILERLSASFRLSADGPATRGGAALATFTVSSADVRALPALGGARPAPAEGTLHAQLTWDGGDLAPGSNLDLNLRPFTWEQGGTAATRVEEGSTLSANVLPPVEGRPATVEWKLHAPRVQHRSEEGWSAEGRNLEARLSSTPPALSPFGHAAELALRVGPSSLQRDHWVLSTDAVSVDGLILESLGAPRLDRARFALRAARLESAASLGGAAGPSAELGDGRFSAEGRLRAWPSGAGYAGQVRAQGADAGVILTLVHTPDLPDWITSKFHGEPFALEAALGVSEEGVRLSELELERGALHVSGWWQLARDRDVGALLLEYGGLSVGIDGESGRVLLRPDAGWLESMSPPPLRACGARDLLHSTRCHQKGR